MVAGCGHFMTEERPEFVVDHIMALTERLAATLARR
jgi:pimeloyl-ACP methyl ester carboxylesterase